MTTRLQNKFYCNLLLAIFLMGGVAACGKKGPLYIPKDNQKSVQKAVDKPAPTKAANPEKKTVVESEPSKP